jgi:Bacterial cadherin-like domain/Bacterial Ig domain
MIINLVYDAQALGAPQSFRDGMEAAATMLEHHMTDNITVNISVGYGEIGGSPVSSNVSVGGPGPNADGTNVPVSYTDLRADLAAHNTSATDQTALDNLPNAASIEGQSNFVIGRAQAKVFGLVGATDSGLDGGVGMGTGFTGNVLFAGAIHELTHAMGRVANWENVNWSVDLFRFNEDGTNTRVFAGNLPPPDATHAYFSIDGGVTDLADFGFSSDPGDFLNGGVQGTDPFNEFVGGRGITPVGLELMDALGFQVANAAPTVTALTGTVGEDGPTFSTNLLSGAADPDTDDISITNLVSSITTTGGRHLTLGTDYTILNSTISLTSTGFAKFNSLAQGVNDTAVFGFNVHDFMGANTPNTLTLTVQGINDPPVANADVGSAGENETKLFDVVANDTDVDIGDTLSLLSIGSVTVSSSNPVINGLVLPTSVFTIDSGEIKFTPSNFFDPLSFTDTATVVVNYTMQDNHAATSSSHLTLTVNGANDAPVIVSGGGGDAATYFVRVNEQAITTVAATDVDVGDVDTFSIVGGADASRFSIDLHTGALSFISHPNQPNRSYAVQVAASDGHGGVDTQLITVNVTADKMNGDIASAVADTFVFHPKFGANTITHFDLNHDFLQFDSGMFSANTAAAVLAAAQDQHGDLVIDVHAGHLTLAGITSADLAAHASDIHFV